jgi:chromosomal replication initiation ATPase DnaA
MVTPPDQLDAGARQWTTRELAARIAGAHGVSVEEMLGPRAERHLAAARLELYRTLRALGWSYPAIGRVVGRHHTTVMAAVRGKQ